MKHNKFTVMSFQKLANVRFAALQILGFLIIWNPVYLIKTGFQIAHFSCKNLKKRLLGKPASGMTLLLLSSLTLTAFTTGQDSNTLQPPEERAAQERLAKSKDKVWDDFKQCKVNLIEDRANDVYLYSINYTPEVKALEGKELTISGFMLPLEATEKFQHFLLSKRTPTCPYCPPGQPNEVVDVWTDKPVAWDENLIKVKGKFEFANDQKLGMFFKLSKADLVK